MKSTDWSIYRCNNTACMQVGHDLRVAVGISNPHCAVCGESLSPLAGAIEDSEMPTMKKFEDDPDPDAKDKVTIPTIERLDPGDDVAEWMRCRDGIDKAEIELRGFCDVIGADVTKSRFQELCRELQNMIHTYYNLGD